jgi:hypothetical protein
VCLFEGGGELRECFDAGDVELVVGVEVDEDRVGAGGAAG